MFYAKGEKVVTTEKIKRTRSIFNNGWVEPGKRYTLLNEGKELTVNCHYKGGGVECERNGAYYELDETEITMVVA